MVTETFLPETAAETQFSTEAYAPASPFAETFHLTADGFGGEAEASYESFGAGSGLESPFRSEYAGGESESAGAPERAEYETLVASLFESEFSEALYELSAEAATVMHEQLGEREYESPGETELLVERYMAPLGNEAEAVFERLSEQYAQHDVSTLSEDEVDRLFESMQPSFEHLSPGFENFLGGLWRKAKSLAKGAINLAKKGIAAVGKIIPLGWIFDKLKKLIRPLLKQVLKYAVGRLPTPLQPVARRLADRLFGEVPGEVGSFEGSFESYASSFEGGSGSTGEALAAGDPDTIQREMDARLSSLFFARDGGEQEVLEYEQATEVERETEDRVAALDAARERFVQEVVQSERGQDLTAQMENFIPAIMAALKLGVAVIGRQRIVNFLAGHLGGLVAPYVGRPLAGQLAGAIVSTGMSMVGLETAADQRSLGGEAVANAVEGTVRRLAEQGEQIFEDQRVLEAAVQEAFAEAAAESFPPDMIREQYQEVSGRLHRKGTWVLQPRAGRRRYKKYTQVLDVRLTRQMAGGIQSFGGIRLNAVLKSLFGVTGQVTVKAHLYESIRGTKLSTIARLEKNVPGLGPTSQRGWQLCIPLTRQTAGLLFGEPDLGRDTQPQYLMSPRRIAVGQRFVVLVPDGWRPSSGPIPAPSYRPGSYPTPTQPTQPPPYRPPVPRRPSTRVSEVNLTLDFANERAIVYIFLNETDAQAVAASVRRGESVTPVLVLLRGIYVAALRSMLSGNARRHVKLVPRLAGEAENEGGGAAGALGAVGEILLKKIADKLLQWLGTAIAEYFTRRGREFLAAAERPADGVTIIVTVRHNSMLQVLQRALRGDAVGSALALTRALLVSADVAIKTEAGFRS
jgi:hypothetical protein